MSAEDLAKLYQCAKTGIENPDSGLGCYAMEPADYDKFNFFFDKVCNDYHNNPAGDKVHETNWSLEGVEGLPADGVLDMRKLGLESPLSMRVRVGRNLTSFPLPGIYPETTHYRDVFRGPGVTEVARTPYCAGRERPALADLLEDHYT